jgi:hypothetical protein
MVLLYESRDDIDNDETDDIEGVKIDENDLGDDKGEEKDEFVDFGV